MTDLTTSSSPFPTLPSLTPSPPPLSHSSHPPSFPSPFPTLPSISSPPFPPHPSKRPRLHPSPSPSTSSTFPSWPSLPSSDDDPRKRFNPPSLNHSSSSPSPSPWFDDTKEGHRWSAEGEVDHTSEHPNEVLNPYPEGHNASFPPPSFSLSSSSPSTSPSPSLDPATSSTPPPVDPAPGTSPALPATSSSSAFPPPDSIDLTNEDEPLIYDALIHAPPPAHPPPPTSVPFYTPHTSYPSHQPLYPKLEPLVFPPSQPSSLASSFPSSFPFSFPSSSPSPSPYPAPVKGVVDLTDEAEEEEIKQPHHPHSFIPSFPRPSSSSFSSAHAPPSSRPLSLPSSVKHEIDLIDDDTDDASLEVKYGTLLANVKPPNPLLTLTPSQSLTLYHSPSTDAPHRLRVVTEDEDDVGTLNPEASVALAPLLLARKVNVEVRVHAVQPGLLTVRVALYGLEAGKREVEFRVRQHNSIEYFDASIPERYITHTSLTSTNPFSSAPSSSPYTFAPFQAVQPYIPLPVGPSITDVESHLDTLFDSEDHSSGYDIDITGFTLPSAIATPLHDYQKQGLVWMIQREAQQVDWKPAKGRSDPSKRKRDPFTNKLLDDEETVETFLSWERRTDKDGRRLYYNRGKGGRPQTNEPEFVKGGILADDMGLGKTLQMISLIAAGKERGEEGPTLIVCPLSVITNWQQQIEQHVKELYRWRVYTYHGGQRVKEAEVLEQHDVVITTYSIVSSEWVEEEKENKEEKEEKKERGRRRKDDSEVDDFPSNNTRSLAALSSPLFAIRWCRIILDEAHNIRERRTRQSRACRALASHSRWAVTGTPFQNRIDDGYPLMHFLRIEPFTSHFWWNKLILQPVKERNPQGVERLQRIMSSVCIRRRKNDELNGRKILNLPEKRSRYIEVPLAEEEKTLYTLLENSAKKEFAELLHQGEALSQFARLLEMLLRLRQACDHISLVPNYYYKNGFGVGGGRLDETRRLLTLLAEGSNDSCALCRRSIDEEEASIVPCCASIFHTDCLNRVFAQASAGPLSVSSGGIACPSCSKLVRKDEVASSDMKEAVSAEESRLAHNSALLSAAPSTHLSSKMRVLLAELHLCVQCGDKAVVFSQWTSFLDLLAPALTAANIRHVRLDGSMVSAARAQALRAFQANADITVFLVSLKAGGVGLNLTAANRVYLMDIWWNPAAEDQAVDRVHRLGQTKAVDVVKMIVRESVEERVLKLQIKKREETAMAMHKVERTRAEEQQERLNDLKRLFGFT